MALASNFAQRADTICNIFCAPIQELVCKYMYFKCLYVLQSLYLIAVNSEVQYAKQNKKEQYI